MDFTKKYRIDSDHPVKLKDFPTVDDGRLTKDDAKEMTQEQLDRLDKLQYLLYAENKHALLIILQALDAGGKDGTIRHVMGPINPQGCKVTSFKAPTELELEHDFLWRIHKAVPARGDIMIFNRSHYEDVLIVRVHDIVPKSVWIKRYDAINAFEKHLTDSYVHILKFYLHISKDEQLERLRERIDDPDKHWKVNSQDFEERKYWDDYIDAFEDAINKCSNPAAPWFVIPADKKWYRNLVISSIIREKLESLDMKFPQPTCDISKIKVE